MRKRFPQVVFAAVLSAFAVPVSAQVVVNEINYHEVSGAQEFVELYAASGPQDITGWTLTDQDAQSFTFDSSDARFPCSEPFVLDAGDLLVIYRGSGTSLCTGPSRAIYLDGSNYLDKAGDDLVLLDEGGTCIDYVEFEDGGDPAPGDCVWTGSNPDNGNVKGTSISRLDNPFSDTDGGLDWEQSGSALTIGETTPGEINSGTDSDGDGVFDRQDNCPADSNPDQANLDRDPFGDLCDSDDDGDNVDDLADICPLDYNPLPQADLDGDGAGDPCDLDDDGDGIDDTSDNCAVVANAGQTDTDGDGLGDACTGIPLTATIPILEQDIRTGHPDWAQHFQQPTARIGVRSGVHYRSLGWLDLSSLVESAEIDDVTLVYWTTSGDPEKIKKNGDLDPSSGDVQADVHPILRPWNFDEPLLHPELNSDNDHTEDESETSWNHALYSADPILNQPWETPGAAGPGDRGPIVATGIVVKAIDSRFEFSSAGLVDLVQDWVSGAAPNYGYLIKASDLDELESKNLKIFAGKGFPLETSTGLGFLEAASHRPHAVVEYHVEPVDPNNQPPVADDLLATTDEDSLVVLTLTGSDPDLDPLSYFVLGAPSHGSLTGSPPKLTYTPDADFHGSDSFEFEVRDGEGGKDTGTVSLDVAPIEDLPTADDALIETPIDTAATIELQAEDRDGDPLTYVVVQAPTFGALSSDDGDETLVYTPDPGFQGADSFQFEVSDGDDTSNLATVSIAVSAALFEDDFDRPDGANLDNGWTEVEVSDSAAIDLTAGRLVFSDTSDQTNRPLARRTFPEASSGIVRWDFLFDWARTGSEGKYFVFMQLGDAALMNDDNREVGVGVNLLWGKIGGVHETLAYQVGGSNQALTQISGPTAVSVDIDLDAETYDVRVDGGLIASGLPFDSSVPLNTVRFLTHSLSEQRFSGRAFDDLVIEPLP